jgi:hypothetical protein
MNGSTHEAQLQLSLDLKDLLIDLAIQDDDLPDSEIDEIDESMDEIVGMIFEALELKVVSVEGSKLTCEITLLPELEEG